MIRLQKLIADAGIASRRAAEKLILEGRVSVDGAVVRALGSKVDPGASRVSVDGVPIKARRKLYVAVNKPVGYLCTRKDPLNRKTILDLLPREWEHLTTVGRLDRDSEGLVFVSNDGAFALRLTHPRYGVRKTYEVVLEGRVDQAAFNRMTAGIEDQGEILKAEAYRILSTNNTRTVVEMILSEGKNREIRRLCAAEGLPVLSLKRTRIGKIKLGELRLGKWRTLTEPEINSLLAAI